MKTNFCPKTRLSKWSLAFVIALIVFTIIFFIIIKLFDQKGGETFFSNLYLAIPLLIAGISGCFAFLTGIVSIIKSKARSVSVYITTLLGFLVLLYGLMEIIFPH